MMVSVITMPTMTLPPALVLDEATTSRLNRLSALWRVSQAEAVRRAVEEAERRMESQKPNPADLLRQLHEKGGGLDRDKADGYLAEVYEDRKKWRQE